MTFYSLYEILASTLHAAIYGLAFALFTVLANATSKELARLIALPREIFCYNGKILEMPNLSFVFKSNGKTQRISKGIFVFLSVFLFTLGFVLLSYYSLDGSIRLYMLAISIIVMICSKPFLYKSIFILIDKLFKSFLVIFVITLRILTIPIVKFLIFIKKIILKEHKS